MTTQSMPLVYVPDRERLFAWGELAPELAPFARGSLPERVELVTPEGRRTVEGALWPLRDGAEHLALLPRATVERAAGSLASWSLASKLALALIARERVAPALVCRSGAHEARWCAVLSLDEDADKFAAIARTMPPAAHAVPVPGERALAVWTAEALLRAYLDAVVDALLRESARALRPLPALRGGWEERFQSALGAGPPGFEPRGFGERTVLDELERWSAPARLAPDRLRACFRLELPPPDESCFVLRFFLQAPDDASLLVSAAEVWGARGRSLSLLGRAFRDPEESLLGALGRAARLFAPLTRALEEARPEALALDPAEAWQFLSEGAALFAQAGFAVIVPAELTAAGARRLRLRMRVGGSTKVAGAVAGAAALSLDELLAVQWDAVIGEQQLTLSELEALASHKAALVRHRGAWVAIDPHELALIRERIIAAPRSVARTEAIELALTGETRHRELPVTVVATGSLAELLVRLREGASCDLPAPATLRGTLRPYQQRGLAWLSTMAALGLGACLADDMGLGKTIQLLAYLLQRAESADARPSLLVAPTSVLGNWEREIERFAPTLRVAAHYGAARAAEAADLPRGADALVITSYGVLRRDAGLLAEVEWGSVVLDEAQNIKNAASLTAQSARVLRATQRFALTGTPVENRLAELWSLLEFANPGLLGPLARFRREIAVPIERYGDERAASKLRRLVEPFVLRRSKRDPTIISDLPEKQEARVVCTLTREQATLYRAVVDEELRRIAEADGIERRGRVLALLTYLKQICNHPAQYLGDRSALAGRSGKLARLTEMLEEAREVSDKALVFTQFFEMGERLVEHLGERLGCEVAFLHGGTSKRARDQLVRAFQDDPRGPPVFVLSLKAGGTGLNLTAANHVFHYDRWWNPAVEDQATDRAYRIGQTRTVQVHKLLCAGTVEEKIDRLLEQKRALAAKVLGGGEHWITELNDEELRALFALEGGEHAEVEPDEQEPATAGAAAPRRSRKGKVRT